MATSQPEAMGEFSQFNGDCVWAAVLMGAHTLQPGGWPLDYALLNALTQQAIAANIGVGPQGQANRAQLEYMLNAWGFAWTSLWADSTAIPHDTLGNILLDSLSSGWPVLLGFSNGQALPGDERGLHGHEIAALRFATSKDQQHYACGDGDNPVCIQTGRAVTYTLDNLVAARCNSAYALIAAPTAPGSGVATAAGGGQQSSILYQATANDGFLPIAQALDDAEQFTPFDITNPVGSIAANVLPFISRLIIVILGILLIIAVLSWYVRQREARVEQVLPELLPLIGAA